MLKNTKQNSIPYSTYGTIAKKKKCKNQIELRMNSRRKTNTLARIQKYSVKKHKIMNIVRRYVCE